MRALNAQQACLPCKTTHKRLPSCTRRKPSPHWHHIALLLPPTLSLVAQKPIIASWLHASCAGAAHPANLPSRATSVVSTSALGSLAATPAVAQSPPELEHGSGAGASPCMQKPHSPPSHRTRMRASRHSLTQPQAGQRGRARCQPRAASSPGSCCPSSR